MALGKRLRAKDDLTSATIDVDCKQEYRWPQDDINCLVTYVCQGGKMFERIVFATDGSEHAQRAQVIARDLARIHKAKLFVVHAYPSLSDFLGFKEYSSIATHRIANGQKILDETVEELNSYGLEVETELLEGPTAEAILHVAEARKADLIVLGARGLGTLTGLMLGSVSQKVLQHAPCPVLVAR